MPSQIESQGMHSYGSTLFVGPWNAPVPASGPLGSTSWITAAWAGTGPSSANPPAPNGQTWFGSTNPNGTAFNSGFSWVQLPELKEADGLNVQPSVTKLTHLRSPNKAQEKVPGFKDPGQFRAKFNYFAALYQILGYLVIPTNVANPFNTDSYANDWGRKMWGVMLPDFGFIFWKGFMVGTPITIPDDDGMSIELTIEISGNPGFVQLTGF